MFWNLVHSSPFERLARHLGTAQGVSHHRLGLRTLPHRQQRGIRLVQRFLREDLTNGGAQGHCDQLQLGRAGESSELM